MIAGTVFRKMKWVLIVVVVGFTGYTYSELNQYDESRLVVISVTDRPISHLATHLLRRKILSGELNGSEALFSALSLAYSEHVDLETAFNKADAILSYGVDIDAEMSLGYAPLIGAIFMNTPEIVVYLLENRADHCVSYKMGSDHKDAISFARYLSSRYPDRDYSRIMEALEDQEQTKDCEEAK